MTIHAAQNFDEKSDSCVRSEVEKASDTWKQNATNPDLGCDSPNPTPGGGGLLRPAPRLPDL
jgi:hypothetical protein